MWPCAWPQLIPAWLAAGLGTAAGGILSCRLSGGENQTTPAASRAPHLQVFNSLSGRFSWNENALLLNARRYSRSETNVERGVKQQRSQVHPSTPPPPVNDMEGIGRGAGPGGTPLMQAWGVVVAIPHGWLPLSQPMVRGGQVSSSTTPVSWALGVSPFVWRAWGTRNKISY